jgi:hypothetical protein
MGLGIAITSSPDERSYAVSESATTKIYIAYVLHASLLAALSLAGLVYFTTGGDIVIGQDVTNYCYSSCCLQ